MWTINTKNYCWDRIFMYKCIYRIPLIFINKISLNMWSIVCYLKPSRRDDEMQSLQSRYLQKYYKFARLQLQKFSQGNLYSA